MCVFGFLLFSSAGPVPRCLHSLFVSLEQHCLWLLDPTCFLLLMSLVCFLAGNASTPLLCCISQVLLILRGTAAILTPMSRPIWQTRRVLRIRSSTPIIPPISMSRLLSRDAISSMKSQDGSIHKILDLASKIRKATNVLQVVDACTEWPQSG